MKKILFIVCIIIIFISCSMHSKRKKIHTVFPEDIMALQLNPVQFIPSLPNELDENSGLIIWDGLLWTINDSGGENVIYGFDFSGKIQKEVEVEDAENDDWEDIAQDEKNIYIGDFGNNFGMRKNQKIYIVRKKDIGKKEKQKVHSKEIEFRYKEQKEFGFNHYKTPYDCESLTELDNSLYIFTKNRSTKTTSVYRIPEKKGTYKLSAVDSFKVQGLVTGADISPDKSKLALLGYEDFTPFLWIFTQIKADSLFSGEKIHIEMDSIYRAQTEGICFWGNDSLLISCEQTDSFNQQVFLFNLNSIGKNGTHSGK